MAAVAVTGSPTALRRWIAYALRDMREAAGKSRQEAAARLGKNPSQLGHLETGRNLPAPADVEVLLEFYGYPERIAGFRELLRAAKRGRDWWRGLRDAVPDWFDLYLGLESSAVQLASYDSLVVPGLLQTPAYAEAIIRDGDPGVTEAEVARRVELRLARQQLLDRPEAPLRVWSVLDEAVLHRPVGGPAVLREQLHHLVALAHRPTIDIQVLPTATGAHPGLDGTFTILTFPPELPGDPTLVYVETRLQGYYYEEPAQVLRYRTDLSRLQALALPPADSVAVITRLAEELPR